MTCYHKKIDLSVSDGVLEPFLLDGFFYRLHNRVVGVSCKVEQKSKCDNADALVLGSKLPVPSSKRYSFSGLRIKYIKI